MGDNVWTLTADEMTDKTRPNNATVRLETLQQKAEKLQRVWDISCQYISGLNNFKGHLAIDGSDSGPPASYGLMGKEVIYVEWRAIDLFYDLCTLVPENARGVGIALKHVMGYGITWKDRNNPLFERYKASVAELFAISETGYTDLIDGFAVDLMYHKRRTPLKSPRKIIRNLFEYLNMHNWNAEFWNGFQTNFGRYHELIEIMDRLPFTNANNNSNVLGLADIIFDVQRRAEEIEDVLERASGKMPVRLDASGSSGDERFIRT